MTHGSHEIDERGYAILPHVFSGTQVQVIRDELANALTQEGKASALAASTNVYYFRGNCASRIQSATRGGRR